MSLLYYLRKLYWSRKITGNDEVGYSASNGKKTLWSAHRPLLLDTLARCGFGEKP